MKTPTASDLLFVYGSLRRACGCAAHQLMVGHFEYLGEGKVNGRLYQGPDFPALVPDPKAGPVCGEIYTYASERATFARLDAYEGYDPTSPEDSEFRRQQVDVTRPDGSVIRAWAYIYQRPIFDFTPVECGDYALYLKQGKAPKPSR